MKEEIMEAIKVAVVEKDVYELSKALAYTLTGHVALERSDNVPLHIIFITQFMSMASVVSSLKKMGHSLRIKDDKYDELFALAVECLDQDDEVLETKFIQKLLDKLKPESEEEIQSNAN